MTEIPMTAEELIRRCEADLARARADIAEFEAGRVKAGLNPIGSKNADIIKMFRREEKALVAFLKKAGKKDP